MSLTCPACAQVMHEVSAPTTSGYALALDQCPGCGGVWCDRWELYPLRGDAALSIDPIDVAAFEEPHGHLPKGHTGLLCPHCRGPMRRWRDPGWPKDSTVARCVTCEGLWLRRGELRRVKAKHNDGKRRLTPRPDALLIRDLDSALYAEPHDENSSLVLGHLLKGGVWVAARLLARALFGI